MKIVVTTYYFQSWDLYFYNRTAFHVPSKPKNTRLRSAQLSEYKEMGEEFKNEIYGH